MRYEQKQEHQSLTWKIHWKHESSSSWSDTRGVELRAELLVRCPIVGCRLSVPHFPLTESCYFPICTELFYEERRTSALHETSFVRGVAGHKAYKTFQGTQRQVRPLRKPSLEHEHGRNAQREQDNNSAGVFADQRRAAPLSDQEGKRRHVKAPSQVARDRAGFRECIARNVKCGLCSDKRRRRWE